MAINYSTEFERYKRYYVSLKPKLQKSRNSAYTAAVFSFLAVSLFAWYAVRPTLQTILFLRREIEDLTTVDQQMEDKISSLIEAQAAYQRIEPQLPLIDEALPTTPEALVLASQLRTIANITQASISGLSFSATPLLDPAIQLPEDTAAVSLEPITVSLVIEGPYDTLTAYLSRLMQFRRLFTVESLTIGQEARSGSDLPFTDIPLQLSLKLNTYFRIAEE